MMKRLIYILTLAALLTACEFRPLVELSNVHYVRVYIDEEIKNVTTGFYNEAYEKPEYESPYVMRLTLADPESGEVKAERFLRDIREDELGTYYEGYIIASPGTYSLMAYNFDTRVTRIDASGNHRKAKAYTNPIPPHVKTKLHSQAVKSDNEKIVYDPDHLFVANCGKTVIGYSDDLDTLKTPDGKWFNAKSIVKSYYLQVRIKGMQYVSSAVSLLSGMSGSAWLWNGVADMNDNSTVYFEMIPGETPSTGLSKAPDDEEVILYTTFSTFGKIPDKENSLQMTFDFMTIYGKPYSETMDITKVFDTEEAIEHQWLLIDHLIEIPEPPPQTGGSLSPTVGNFDEIHTEIII